MSTSTANCAITSHECAAAANSASVRATASLLCGNGCASSRRISVLGLGAVVVPMNPQSPSPEIVQEIATVGATVVLVEPAAAGAWNGVDRAAVPSVRHVIAVEAGTVEADSTYDDLTSADPLDVVEVEADALAVLIFTSGTAGSPRAAMLSHGNLLANLEQSRSAAGRIESDDIVYGVLPMFHIFGLNVVLALSLASGATIVLVQRFDPRPHSTPSASGASP